MLAKYDSSNSCRDRTQLALRSSVAAPMYATLLVNKLAPLMRHKASPMGMPKAPNRRLKMPGFAARYAGHSCRIAEKRYMAAASASEMLEKGNQGCGKQRSMQPAGFAS